MIELFEANEKILECPYCYNLGGGLGLGFVFEGTKTTCKSCKGEFLATAENYKDIACFLTKDELKKLKENK